VTAPLVRQSVAVLLATLLDARADVTMDWDARPVMDAKEARGRPAPAPAPAAPLVLAVTEAARPAAGREERTVVDRCSHSATDRSDSSVTPLVQCSQRRWRHHQHKEEAGRRGDAAGGAV
jgi:hypothetical protein